MHWKGYTGDVCKLLFCIAITLYSKGGLIVLHFTVAIVGDKVGSEESSLKIKGDI